MKTSILTNSEIKKGSRQEIRVVNNNPVWLFRKLNKIAAGKDQDTKEVEGFSRDYLKELFSRLTEAFNCGGFWWGSVCARQGFIITAAREVTFAEGAENNDDVKGLSVAKGEVVLTEVIDGKMYSLKAASVWNFNNIIASASLWLKFAEVRAKASNNLYSWQKEQEQAKAKQKQQKQEQAKKARKEQAKIRKEQKEQEQAEATKAKEQAKQIAALNAKYQAKEINKKEYTKQLLALVG